MPKIDAVCVVGTSSIVPWDGRRLFEDSKKNEMYYWLLWVEQSETGILKYVLKNHFPLLPEFYLYFFLNIVAVVVVGGVSYIAKL